MDRDRPNPRDTEATLLRDVHERGQADVKFRKLLREHERAVYFTGVRTAVSNAQNAYAIGYGSGYTSKPDPE